MRTRTADRRRRHDDEEHADRWVISYADFITLLFAFFTTLYAISRVDGGKLEIFSGSVRHAFGASPRAAIRPVIEPVQTVPAELRRIGNEVQASFTGMGEEGDIAVTVDDRGVVVALGERILFEPGQAVLRESAGPVIGALAAVIAAYSNPVVIEGHTDNLPLRSGGGRYRNNWELSSARAASVLVSLISEYGISPGRLSAAGYAEYRPAASNETPGGRARNRRIAVILRPFPGGA